MAKILPQHGARPCPRQMRAFSVQRAMHKYAGSAAARWVEPGIAGPPTTRRTLAPPPVRQQLVGAGPGIVLNQDILSSLRAAATARVAVSAWSARCLLDRRQAAKLRTTAQPRVSCLETYASADRSAVLLVDLPPGQEILNGNSGRREGWHWREDSVRLLERVTSNAGGSPTLSPVTARPRSVPLRVACEAVQEGGRVCPVLAT